MGNDNEDKGFKVVDRRSAAEEPAAPAAAKAEEAVKGPGWEMHEEKPERPLPPMDFTTFCLSLASSAMIHLGHAPSPDSGATEKSLPLAKQTIDILVLLEEKTRGNLTAEEGKLLSTVLYDLRMRYVQENTR
ncbi:MAG TPA: DUF1844 domain-containing protein [Myxococcales bacterium]|jgi:hypothetical protein